MALPGSLKARVFYTEPIDENVHTLRVLTDGDFRKLPIIDMQGNAQLEISFDYISDEQPWLSYYIVHCDAQWQEDDLGEMDFMEGFMPVHVGNCEPSFNTLTQYWHYSVSFPNEDVNLLVSGNYAIVFHLDNEPEEEVAIATFSVSEQMAFANADVSANTDIDFQSSHQQLTLGVSWSKAQMPNLNPLEDLLIVVQQNRRRDNQRLISKPSRMTADRAYYEHNRDLIFEAGNSWRRFEYTDVHYPGMGIDHVEFHSPDYCVFLIPDQKRSDIHYRYDQDQHGRYLIRALRVSDKDTEAEYFRALFTLDASPSLLKQGVYLMGDLTGLQANDNSRMEYDFEAGVFYKELLLKQGHYNYMYMTAQGEKLTTSIIEGNKYETANEYEILIYYRPFGSRYDRLIGFSVTK